MTAKKHGPTRQLGGASASHMINRASLGQSIKRNSIPADRLLVQVDEHLLRLEIFFYAPMT